MNNKALVVIDLQNDITKHFLNRHVAGAADLRICAHDGDFDADPKLDKCKRVQ